MKKIFRSLYMNDLFDLKNTPDIKIITGVSRCGKSQLTNDFKEYLEKNESNINIVYIDFKDIILSSIKLTYKLKSIIKSDK